MNQTISQHLARVKQASCRLTGVPVAMRNQVLVSLAMLLRESVDAIITENKRDLVMMDPQDPKYDRLLLTTERIHGIADDLDLVASLPWADAQILEERLRPNGLVIHKVTVALGVIAIIYESRPNVTIDAFALCFKAGNACILKGGKEAHYSNVFLVGLIKKSLEMYQIDSNIIYLMPSDRQALHVLLQAVDIVDACIPRGSQGLINFVREHARIPFIETGAGIVHNYFDATADLQKGAAIINNAKTRRVSVCNALDTLVIHEQRLCDLPTITALLATQAVELFADQPAFDALKTTYPTHLLHLAQEKDYGQEFLDYKMSIKTVKSVEEAVRHIMQYTSGHSEAIIATDQQAIDYFLTHVDAAAVYVNASTGFTDGGQFGMGAEIGISTQKLHARGPMGLEALSSYKWIIRGNGQIRG